MIRGEHAVVRAADLDDAPSLWCLYDTSRPRSFLLGPAREVLVPTRDELEQLLARKDVHADIFFVVEDLTGEIRGGCLLRGGLQGSFYSEVALAFADDADYETPIAEEVFAFLRHRAFVERKANKIMAHCIETETEYRAFLDRQGFQSDGVQRDMVFTLGRYFDLESLSLFPEPTEED